MGAKEGSVVSSIELYEETEAIIQKTMAEMQMSKGAAVRFLIGKGKEQIEWEKAVLARAKLERGNSRPMEHEDSGDNLVTYGERPAQRSMPPRAKDKGSKNA